MNKSDFLHILSDAQQHHEGWSEATGAAWPNLNPGNLKFMHQHGAIQTTSGFCEFFNFYDGKQAQLNDLGAKYDAGLRTIRSIITEYAPPNDNDTEAYIKAVVDFFELRNVIIDADYDIPTFLAQFNKPTVLIAVNKLYVPADWHAVQQAVSKLAAYMPQYAFSVRNSNADLSDSITRIMMVSPPGQYSGVSQQATHDVIAPYNQGQVLNVLIYDGKIMQGHLTPYGGCEFHGVHLPQAKVSNICSAMYEGPSFVDSFSRVLFHEIIHELFDVTEQTDSLHQYLLTHAGYPQNTAQDLEAVFSGSELNTPAAVASLERQERSLP